MHALTSKHVYFSLYNWASLLDDWVCISTTMTSRSPSPMTPCPSSPAASCLSSPNPTPTSTTPATTEKAKKTEKTEKSTVSLTEEHKSFLIDFAPEYFAMKNNLGGTGPRRVRNVKGKQTAWLENVPLSKFIDKFVTNTLWNPNRTDLATAVKRVFWNLNPAKYVGEPGSGSSSPSGRKKPRATNALLQFKSKEAKTITNEVKKSREPGPIDVEKNLPIWNGQAYRLYKALPPEDQAKYQDMAREHNDKLQKPPERDEIFKNQLTIEDHAMAALADLCGWDWGQAGDIAFLVMGSYKDKDGNLQEFHGSVITDSNGMAFIAPDASRKDVHGALTNFLDEHTRPADNGGRVGNEEAIMPPAIDKGDKDGGGEGAIDKGDKGGGGEGQADNFTASEVVEDDSDREDGEGSGVDAQGEGEDGGEDEDGGGFEDGGEDKDDEDGGDVVSIPQPQASSKHKNGSKTTSQKSQKSSNILPKQATSNLKGNVTTTASMSRRNVPTAKQTKKVTPSKGPTKTANKRRATEAPSPGDQPIKKKARVEPVKDTSGGTRRSSRGSSRPTKYPS
ncbi:hypothetical protein BDN72DRAFT_430190 [Pluteus cervinus]|uniref:Uncharacterized protein n=1 Tax=Pluteus cervinus TaxID=181527 RepID=A0ACD3A8K2_9AGAR|nr:hypothetical protein BDN72DRAFT_430190 [Pluteus cervinus]